LSYERKKIPCLRSEGPSAQNFLPLGGQAPLRRSPPQNPPQNVADSPIFVANFGGSLSTPQA